MRASKLNREGKKEWRIRRMCHKLLMSFIWVIFVVTGLKVRPSTNEIKLLSDQSRRIQSFIKRWITIWISEWVLETTETHHFKSWYEVFLCSLTGLMMKKSDEFWIYYVKGWAGRWCGFTWCRKMRLTAQDEFNNKLCKKLMLLSDCCLWTIKETWTF